MWFLLGMESNADKSACVGILCLYYYIKFDNYQKHICMHVYAKELQKMIIHVSFHHIAIYNDTHYMHGVVHVAIAISSTSGIANFRS